MFLERNLKEDLKCIPFPRASKQCELTDILQHLGYEKTRNLRGIQEFNLSSPKNKIHLF